MKNNSNLYSHLLKEKYKEPAFDIKSGFFIINIYGVLWGDGYEGRSKSVSYLSPVAVKGDSASVSIAASRLLPIRSVQLLQMGFHLRLADPGGQRIGVSLILLFRKQLGAQGVADGLQRHGALGNA